MEREAEATGDGRPVRPELPLLTGVLSWAALLLHRGSWVGGLINIVLLRVEAVFWVGFALPIPWLVGIARAALVMSSWNSLD